MIELISETKCIECNRCVNVCPTNVFDAVEGQIPVIARLDACQTCFMCELYCPTDALYVAPEAEMHVHIIEDHVEQTGLLGSYKDAFGWRRGQTSVAKSDSSYKLSKYF